MADIGSPLGNAVFGFAGMSFGGRWRRFRRSANQWQKRQE